MKKTIYSLLFMLCSASCVAQNHVSMEHNKLEIYFNKRVSAILQTLYRHGLNGSITAYRNDSFVSYYNAEELKTRTKLTVKDYTYQPAKKKPDSTSIRPFNAAADLRTFTYIASENDATSGTSTTSLKGLCLQYQPKTNNPKLKLPLNTLFYLQWNDIKNVLPAEDTEFLMRYYGLMRYSVSQPQLISYKSVALNVNGMLIYPYKDNDMYLLEHKLLNHLNYYQADSINNTYYARYIHIYLNAFLKNIKPNEKLFFNSGAKAYESENEMAAKYLVHEVIQVGTAYEGEFIDSIITIPANKYTNDYNFGYQLAGDTIPGALTYMVHCYDSSDRQTINPPMLIYYSIPWPEVKKRHPYPWMTWFAEDYYRYQLKN